MAETSNRRILVSSLFLPDLGRGPLEQECRRLLGDASNKNCWHIPTAVYGEGASARQAESRAQDLKRMFGFANLLSTDIREVTGEDLKRQIEELQPSCISL